MNTPTVDKDREQKLTNSSYNTASLSVIGISSCLILGHSARQTAQQISNILDGHHKVVFTTLIV